MELDVLSISVTTFSDPEELEHAYSATRVHILPTGRGRFHASAMREEVGNAWLHRVLENSPHIKYIEHKISRAFVRFRASRGGSWLIGANELPPDAIVVSRDGQSYFERMTGSVHWSSISLPISDLAAPFVALTGQDILHLAYPMCREPPASSFDRLRQLHADLLDLAVAHPDVVSRPEVSCALQQALIGAVADCLGASHEPAAHVPLHQQTSILKKLHDMFERYPERPLYLPEVCIAIGVSERTLRRACQDYLGLGPKSYLQLRRMHLAHRALRAATYPSVSVTEVATRFGFWHLGRFATQYRSLFGETPSQTLKQMARFDSEHVFSPWHVPGRIVVGSPAARYGA